MNPFKFSFIVGYRHTEERFLNLKKLIEWVSLFNECDLIIVEQDKISYLEDFNFRGRHVFAYSDLPYNRSWGFNIGARYSKTEKLVLGDCDLIMDHTKFIEAFNKLEEFEVVSPYDKVIDLDYKETKFPFLNIFNIQKPERGSSDNQKINLSGGMTFFRKDSYFKISGYDEKFIGWGGEDDFMTHKIKKYLKWIEIENNCYHLYHSKVHIDQNYNNNLKLLNELINLNETDLTSYINKQRDKIGKINKIV